MLALRGAERIETMPGNIELIDHRTLEAGYQPPNCRVSGRARGTTGVGFSLWDAHAVLDDGASVAWSDDHGDEVLYLMRGELVGAGGQHYAPGGALVVEAGVPFSVSASGETEIMHFGPVDKAPPQDGPLGPATSEGHSVRYISAEAVGKVTVESPSGSIYKQRFFADGDCPTSRLALFNVQVNKVTGPAPHAHTQDEIIHVLSGDMYVGAVKIPAGVSVAVRNNARYSFTTPGPLEFLNYRRDASHIVLGVGANRRLGLETVASKLDESESYAHGEVT